MNKEKSSKLDKIAALKRKVRLREGLPHIYGWPHYPWSRKYFESTNHYNFLCSANQIGKSTINIRKCVHWATEEKLWPKLWRTVPRQYWYLYPTKDVATSEYETKWKTEILPSGDYKLGKKYGWEEEKEAKKIKAIHFKKKPSIYFRTYRQDVQFLQTSTVHAVFCFSGDTLVITSAGLKPIRNISIGDFVLTKSGFNRVKGVFSRYAEVGYRYFKNGEYLIGTKDHPVFTNKGWVDFAKLTDSHQCATVPLWKLIKNWYYLTEKFIRVFRKIRIIGRKIISGTEKAKVYISHYGKHIIRNFFPKGFAYTIKTLTHLITGSRIWSLCQERSILAYTNLKNGRKKGYMNLCVPVVEGFSKQEAQKERANVGVHQNAKVTHGFVLGNVLDAVKSFLVRKILNRDFVPKSVRIETPQWKELGKGKVYNLQVELDPTYYANGILVHNCDEEIPEELFDELNMRIQGVDGYFHAAFTATLGQELWRRTMEPTENEKPAFPGALKLQISMYDCLKYEDGSPSHWTRERIQRIKDSCKSESEIQRRVYGRFVKSEGLRYPKFERSKNVCAPYPIPSNWNHYVGIDVGSGNVKAHPAAIVFIAVNPDFTKGAVTKCWRGDNQLTTAGDVMTKFQMMRGNLTMAGMFYDYESRDFKTIAERIGEPFQPAEKSHDIGEQTINTLFQYQMVDIFDEGENFKLITEMNSLGAARTKAVNIKDDLADGFRYAVTKIPWNWTALDTVKEVVARAKVKTIDEMRREFMQSESELLNMDEVTAEIEEWNEAYGG